MAVNELTGIDRENDRFVLFLPGQTNSVNANAMWPRTDGGPVNGGFTNGDQYYKKVTVEPPATDHRYTVTAVYGKVNTVPTPPAGYPVGTWQAVYTVTPLPLADLLTQIESEYDRQVRLQLPQTNNNAAVALVGGLVIRQQSGASLTSEETALLEQYVDVANKVAQLRVRYQELVDAATAGDDYDLTIWPTLS